MTHNETQTIAQELTNKCSACKIDNGHIAQWNHSEVIKEKAKILAEALNEELKWLKFVHKEVYHKLYELDKRISFIESELKKLKESGLI